MTETDRQTETERGRDVPFILFTFFIVFLNHLSLMFLFYIDRHIDRQIDR